MLIAEYDYATDIAVQRQEAREAARKEVWEEAWKQASEETWDKASKELPEKTLKQTALNLLKAGVDVSIIASSTGLSSDVILKLQEQR